MRKIFNPKGIDKALYIFHLYRVIVSLVENSTQEKEKEIGEVVGTLSAGMQLAFELGVPDYESRIRELVERAGDEATLEASRALLSQFKVSWNSFVESRNMKILSH